MPLHREKDTGENWHFPWFRLLFILLKYMFRDLTVSLIVACHLSRLLQYLPAQLSSWELNKQMEQSILGRWWTGKHQEVTSPPRQQLHRQNLLWDNAGAPRKEKRDGGLLSHQQEHSPWSFPLTPNSGWHIMGHMVTTLVLRDLRFCGRRCTGQLGGGKWVRNLLFCPFILYFTSGFTYTFLYNLHLIPFSSPQFLKMHKLPCFEGRALIPEGGDVSSWANPPGGKPTGQCYREVANPLLQNPTVLGTYCIKI